MVRVMFVAAVALTAVQGPASAFDCKRFTDIVAPALADFKGAPGQYTINAQGYLEPTPSGAYRCSASPSSKERNSAVLRCEYSFGAEEVARAVYQAYVNNVAKCQPGQLEAAIDRPLKPGEVAVAGAKNETGDQGWIFRLNQGDGEWKVIVSFVAASLQR